MHCPGEPIFAQNFSALFSGLNWAASPYVKIQVIQYLKAGEFPALYTCNYTKMQALH